MADIFLDSFDGAAGTIVGHDAGAGHVWAAPFVGEPNLRLSGTGTLLPPVSGSGDGQVRIPEFIGEDKWDIEFTFGGPLTAIVQNEYGVQTVGDLTPGNWYINFTATGGTVRWYTEGGTSEFFWPDAITAGTKVRLRFNVGAGPNVTIFFDEAEVIAYGDSPTVMGDHIWRISAGSDSSMILSSMRAAIPEPPPTGAWRIRDDFNGPQGVLIGRTPNILVGLDYTWDESTNSYIEGPDEEGEGGGVDDSNSSGLIVLGDGTAVMKKAAF